MDWILAISVIVAGALTVAAWRWRARAPRPSGASSRNDRYASQAVITPGELRLQAYLQEAFPDHVVLFAQPLARLVSVRYSQDGRRAQQRLQDLQVDFVVCTTDGKPAFAFQADAFRSDSDEQARREAAVKHRVLATAGVRLLRLKESVRQLPPPHEFRQRLQDAALGDGADSQPAASAPLRVDNVPVLTQAVRFGRGGRLESESLSLSDIMGLQEARR